MEGMKGIRKILFIPFIAVTLNEEADSTRKEFLRIYATEGEPWFAGQV